MLFFICFMRNDEKRTPITNHIAEVSAELFLIMLEGNKSIKPIWAKSKNKTKEDSK